MATKNLRDILESNSGEIKFALKKTKTHISAILHHLEEAKEEAHRAWLANNELFKKMAEAGDDRQLSLVIESGESLAGLKYEIEKAMDSYSKLARAEKLLKRVR